MELLCRILPQKSINAKNNFLTQLLVACLKMLINTFVVYKTKNAKSLLQVVNV